eukprot:CAMPEP_0173313470 /NCGR_PEP_ID=MMETSP1143-20121109/24763_1 /TAXON_ID=483371 /ORGANISM="non described non described, Strain CCMP2298" /LENGTH=183 /DNA_ID=CAMNT_0014255895 /DNA_START=192 /DNA_END=739 /DNA_ORIENTATION=-
MFRNLNAGEFILQARDIFDENSLLSDYERYERDLETVQEVVDYCRNNQALGGKKFQRILDTVSNALDETKVKNEITDEDELAMFSLSDACFDIFDDLAEDQAQDRDFDFTDNMSENLRKIFGKYNARVASAASDWRAPSTHGLGNSERVIVKLTKSQKLGNSERVIVKLTKSQKLGNSERVIV